MAKRMVSGCIGAVVGGLLVGGILYADHNQEKSILMGCAPYDERVAYFTNQLKEKPLPQVGAQRIFSGPKSASTLEMACINYGVQRKSGGKYRFFKKGNDYIMEQMK